MPDDWYRRKTWTPKDQEEFFARLRRSRGAYHKAQYVRVQACELMTARTPAAYSIALELFDMILAEWREDAQLALVYLSRAECFLGLGDPARALDAYRLVFQIQRNFNGLLTMAHLDFGWLVVTTPLPELFDEALALLDEYARNNAFPAGRYRAAAIQALILDARGQRDQARHFATLALQETTASHSGFRYHPNMGLVKSPDEQVLTRLKALAS